MPVFRAPVSVLVGFTVALGGSLAACSMGSGVLVQSARQLLPRGSAADATPLDPKFAYLRVTRGGHVGLLWRGSTERAPEGLIEVYYSGSGEVVRLLNGRIVGALGLTTEWRQVSVAAPGWGAVASTGRPERFVRTRDVMPGYQTGVRDHLELRVVPAPAGSALRGVEANTLTWFAERLETPSRLQFPAGTPGLPPARYAVDLAGGQELVVYGEQCLASDLCFTWQRWSAAMQQASAGPAKAP
jgi:hypothetical protein